LRAEVNFRDQSHATYKLLFNTFHYGDARIAPIDWPNLEERQAA